MRNHKFCSGVDIKTWVVAVISTGGRQAQERDIWSVLTKLISLKGH